MSEFDKSIAHEAHGLVHGERAKTYGHPRFDFTAIGKVWTGLLQDVLKEGVVLDAYRVAILMTGLKLCRLVKSPDHHDSRVDTIGYMLTMERLDEPEEANKLLVNMGVATEEELARKPCVGFCGEDYCPSCGGDGPGDDIDYGDYDVHGRPVEDDEADPRANQIKFNQVNVWFEGGESKLINGREIKNGETFGQTICFPFLPGTTVKIEKPPPPETNSEFPKFGTPEFDAKVAEVAAEQAKSWPKTYDQTLPFQPPGLYYQGDDGREWVRDPTRRWWIFDTGQYHRLADAEVTPPGWVEAKCPAHGNAQCPACSQNPDPGRCQCGYFEVHGMHWDTCPGRIRSFPANLPRDAETKIHEDHGGPKDCWCGFLAVPLNDDGTFGKILHNHRAPEPCVPGCPVFDAAKAKNVEQINSAFEFTGEQVGMEPSTPWERND